MYICSVPEERTNSMLLLVANSNSDATTARSWSWIDGTSGT